MFLMNIGIVIGFEVKIMSSFDPDVDSDLDFEKNRLTGGASRILV
jgi:hypothetical protein